MRYPIWVDLLPSEGCGALAVLSLVFSRVKVSLEVRTLPFTGLGSHVIASTKAGLGLLVERAAGAFRVSLTNARTSVAALVSPDFALSLRALTISGSASNTSARLLAVCATINSANCPMSLGVLSGTANLSLSPFTVTCALLRAILSHSFHL